MTDEKTKAPMSQLPPRDECLDGPFEARPRNLYAHRVYLFYTDVCNFERVDVRETNDGYMTLTWEAMGTGSWRQPIAEIVGDKVIVRAHPILERYATDPNPHVVVKGGAGKMVEFSEFPLDAVGVVAQR